MWHVSWNRKLAVHIGPAKDLPFTPVELFVCKVPLWLRPFTQELWVASSTLDAERLGHHNGQDIWLEAKGSLLYPGSPFQRLVYNFELPKEASLRAGVTLHTHPGTWSSYPRHGFERAQEIKDFAEFFIFKLEFKPDPRVEDPLSLAVVFRSGFFGSEFIEDAKTVGDGDVLEIPLGWHIVGGFPQTIVQYFWVYTSNPLIDKAFKDGAYAD